MRNRREAIRLITRKSGYKFWLFREGRGAIHRIPYAGELPKQRERIEIPAHILAGDRAEREAARASGGVKAPMGTVSAGG